jgi:alpha-tubulin suppressor-like RCC1 family protein
MNKRLVCLLFTILVIFTVIFFTASETKAAGVTQKITPVAGGMSHSIALKEDGTIWTWGANHSLQLGKDEEVVEQPKPEQLNDISSIISVAAGYDFSLALSEDGSVYVLGEEGDSPIYKAPNLKGIVAIAAGQVDGLALDKDGTVWQWLLGERPQKVAKLSHVAAITAGGAHFLALTSSGEVWAWGSNWSGQLGNGSTTDANEPAKLKNLVNIISVAAGYSHSLAVAHDGSVYAWGSNSQGQLGDGTTETRLSPILVKNITNAILASAGNESSMALTETNEIFTWGYGEYGQLGDGTETATRNKPTKITTTGTPIFITSGVYHNFYIANDGNLYAWGRNKNNPLGTDKTSNESKPVKVLASMAYDVAYSTDPLMGASAWAKPELSKLYDTDLLPPMLWESYQEHITRAEFAALLVNIYESVKGKKINLPTYPPYKTNFGDIKDHVYETEIKKAFFIEMVGGISATHFNPNGKITRQEATKMICTFIGLVEDLPLPTGLQDLSYYDDETTIADWAAPFVAFAYENNIMQGSAGNFYPLNNLSREQTLAIIYRTILMYEWV